MTLKEFRLKVIKEALDKHNSVSKAAKELCIPPKTIYNYIKENKWEQKKK